MDTHCISLAWWMTEIYLLVKCFHFDRVHVLETIKWNALHLKRMVDISIQVYIIVNWSMCIVEYHICAYGFFLLFNFGFFPLFLSTVAMLDAMPLSFSFNHNQIKALNNDCACIRYLSSMWCDERAMQMNHNTKYNKKKIHTKTTLISKWWEPTKKKFDNSNNKCHKY